MTSAAVIELRQRAMTRAQVQDFLAQDTYQVDGVAAWWTEGSTEILVATNDRAVAALAADEMVRRQLHDSLRQAFGGVAVDEPMSVELLGEPGADVTWQRAPRSGSHTVLVCRVWAGEDGPQ